MKTFLWLIISHIYFLYVYVLFFIDYLIVNSHSSQIWNNHFSLINHWFISKTYCASDFGLYDGHSSVLQGSILIISTIFKSESIRIHASGINVFFIQKEYVHVLLNTKSIQFVSGKFFLYMSHSCCDSGVSAISRLKQLLLQQIFGFSVSHALYLNTRKERFKSRMNVIVQIIIFVDFFMWTCYVVNIFLVVISTVGRNPFVCLLCGFPSSFEMKVRCE